jgi:uncharacterized XkdX family phage protein
MYQLIKKYYKMGLYSNDSLAKFVARGTLTEAQYQKITGEKFSR